jgi:hypothetical protein
MLAGFVSHIFQVLDLLLFGTLKRYKKTCQIWEWRSWSRSHPQNLPSIWSGHNKHDSPNLLGKGGFHLPAERWNFLPCSAWRKNCNSTGLSRDMREGLSDRKRIGGVRTGDDWTKDSCKRNTRSN